MSDMINSMGKVNGYPVIAAAFTPQERGTRPGRVIVVDRGCTHDRFVVAWNGWTPGFGWDKEWCSGTYCMTAENAFEAFAHKCRRYHAMAAVGDPVVL